MGENKMENNKIGRSRENNMKFTLIIYYIFGILEALLGFRLIFKLLGANPGSAFVSIIYDLTGIFLAPFIGIFRSAVTNGIETKAVLEPTTVIAMIVYALIAYGLVKLIVIFKTPKNPIER